MNCPEVREALPAYVRDGQRLSEVTRHLDDCAACRAERARYEQLLDALGGLEAQTFEPPSELLSALAAIPRHNAGLAAAVRGRAEVMRDHVARNRNVYVGGASLALVGAAGAVLVRSRMRRPALA